MERAKFKAISQNIKRIAVNFPQTKCEKVTPTGGALQAETKDVYKLERNLVDGEKKQHQKTKNKATRVLLRKKKKKKKNCQREQGVHPQPGQLLCSQRAGNCRERVTHTTR